MSELILPLHELNLLLITEYLDPLDDYKNLCQTNKYYNKIYHKFLYFYKKFYDLRNISSYILPYF